MFQKDISLSKYSNYRIGGEARYFYIARNLEGLIKAVERAKKDGLNAFILGGGTNLLINDEGFKGLVLKPEINLLKVAGDRIRVGAGVLMTQLLNYSITKGLSGLEWAGGLPGTVGGAIRGNAGAFGGETKDAILEVVSLDISGKASKIVRRTNKECWFGYRNSAFKINDGREIILEATLVLKKGDKKSVRDTIEEKIRYRQERHPMEHPNIGSIFKNIDAKNAPEKWRKIFAAKVKNDPFPVLPTAVLLAEAGLKGVSCGGAMISPKHPNFIVNVGGASAEDVKKLIGLVKSTIKTKFGVELEEEIQYV